MESNPSLHEIYAGLFIDHCKDKFGWQDLTSDVIMDIGLGEKGNCGKAILAKFPDVTSIIGVDGNPQVLHKFKQESQTKIQCVVADIEKRNSLGYYEGRMNKVVSTNVFHQLMEKEEAFRNMYRLLKPGGEAAVLFIIKSISYEWLTEMLKNTKWKDAYRGYYEENLYKGGFGADQYKEMVEKIGFQVTECSEIERVIPYPSDEICKEDLYEMNGKNFMILPDLLEEFKEERFQVLLKLGARDAEGSPCFRYTHLSLLLVKPTEGSVSKTKGKTGS
ncbi:unnamed protein product [Larinioides sclopetarius]